MSNRRIGIKSVHSVLRKATQSNLSMFHNIGDLSEDSVLPKPSISDILELNNNASCSASGVYNTNLQIKDVKGTKLKDIVKFIIDSDCIKDDDPENIFYEYGNYRKPDNFTRLILDSHKFIPLGFTLSEIVNLAFINKPCCISPDFMGIIDIVHSTNSSADEMKEVLSRMDILLQGSLNIKNAIIIKDTVYTVGSSIKTLMKVCDPKTVKSNNIEDVEKVFGIEAARHLIINLINDDTYPTVIANFMTRSGKTRALKKDNLILYKRGFISELSFERSRDSIISSIANSDKERNIDNMTSIYSRLWSGEIKNKKSKNDETIPNYNVEDYF